MTNAATMLRTRPGTPDLDPEALARCIDACFECAQTCTACAEACRRCQSACNDFLGALG